MNLIGIKKLNTTIEKVINNQMASIKLTSTQSDILCYLYLNRSSLICQKDVECALLLSRPTVSSVLKRLEEKNMIYTEYLKGDHRYKQIILTEKSENIMKQVFKIIDGIYKKATVGFSDAEIKQFFQYVERMNANLI